MKKDTAEKWVAALRSGKYKQGRGLLRNSDNEYCCLGVLCEILEIPSKYIGDNEFYHYEGYSQTLPKSAQERSDMASKVGKRSALPPLTELNDSGVSFTEIADIIEREYASL